MSVNQHAQPTAPPGTSDAAQHERRPSSHRLVVLAVVVFFCVGLSLVLYTHGAELWYAPLAVLGVIVAHVVVLAVIAFAVTRGARSRHASDDRDQGHSHAREGVLIRKPRLYDNLVKVITFGREARLRRWLLDRADLRLGDAVLDVGCGTGTLLLAAAERVGEAGTLRGIDLATEMIEHARRKADAHGVVLDVAEGSADALPYPDASLDVVFCTLVLHHLPEPVQAAAIREMRRVLRPGGRLAVADIQRPRSIAGAFTLISILHGLGHGGSQPDSLAIEPLLTELGFADIVRGSFGAGDIGVVTACLPAAEQAPTEST